ncbi:hypothetical protein B0H16DRAFT_1268502, partial [Mycena metata]
PSFSLPVRIPLLVRFTGAMYCNIDDCDEGAVLFNFWEPLHSLEVSPEYAIRSWAYIVLHIFPAKFSKLLLTGDK